MAVFVELVTDAFSDTFNAQAGKSLQARRAGVSRARRPLRGLEIKEDTYAIIKVIQADGSEIPLIDSSSSTGTSTQYSNFLLQSVQEARMEKHQIVETFGEPYIYFFGESPRFLDVTAILVDSNDFNWYAEFWANYNNYLRGTKSVEIGARTYLFYDDNVVEGYMLNAAARKTSDTPLMVQLQFRMYLTNYQNVSFVGDPNFPIHGGVNLPAGIDLTAADAFTVAQSAANVAGQAAQNESNALLAATGAAQQASGFGGGDKLSDAIRSGITSTGTPSIDGYLQNAQDAIGNQSRTAPLRGKIADNIDEYTAVLPAADDTIQDIATPGMDGVGDVAGSPNTPDLHNEVIQKTGQYGGLADSPDFINGIGLGPRFTSPNGFGIRGGAGATASFGVTGGGSVSSSYRGGLNGGLGFTGVFTAATTASLAADASPSTTGAASASITPNASSGVYGNGVPISVGIYGGTGIGGGIPGGLASGIGPGGPGTLSQYQGGNNYSSANGFGSSGGYGQGLSGNGASVNVGGYPSAFASAVVEGTLDLNAPPPSTFFIGPDGQVSDVNTSGYRI